MDDDCCEARKAYLQQVASAVIKADYSQDIWGDAGLVKVFGKKQSLGTFSVSCCDDVGDACGNDVKSSERGMPSAKGKKCCCFKVSYEPDLPSSTEKESDVSRVKKFVFRALQVEKNPMYMQLTESYDNLIEEIGALIRTDKDLKAQGYDAELAMQYSEKCVLVFKSKKTTRTWVGGFFPSFMSFSFTPARCIETTDPAWASSISRGGKNAKFAEGDSPKHWYYSDSDEHGEHDAEAVSEHEDEEYAEFTRSKSNTANTKSALSSSASRIALCQSCGMLCLYE